MDTLKKRFVGSAELSAAKPEHGFDLVGPVKVAGLDVPIPTADIGRSLGHRITFFAALQCLLRLYLLGDVANDPTSQGTSVGRDGEDALFHEALRPIRTLDCVDEALRSPRSLASAEEFEGF